MVSWREDTIISIWEDKGLLFYENAARSVLEARNLNNPILSDEGAQCGGGNARARQRARGTPLLDSPVVACLPHAIRAPHLPLPHTALHFVALMWGYGDFCF